MKITIYAWLIRFVSILQELNNISKDFNSSKIALWPPGQYIFQHTQFTSIFLPNMLSSFGVTLFEHRAVWVSVVFFTSQQWCWGQHSDHTSSMSFQSKAHDASRCPIRKGPALGWGHIGKLSFLNDSHCCGHTKARFWILACGCVLRSSVWRIHHPPKQGAKCFKKSVKTWYFQNTPQSWQLTQVQQPLWAALPPPPAAQQFCTGALKKEYKIIDIVF